MSDDPSRWEVRPEGDGDWEIIQHLPDDAIKYTLIAYGLTEKHARLIAAAHDMLAALKAVVAIADRRTDEFDAARAAIAKAEGRAALSTTRGAP